MNWVALSAIHGFAAVLLGAFGAHGLEKLVDEKSIELWKTAAHYHLIHSAVLLVVSFVHYPLHRFKKALRCFLFGIMLFSGSLYLLAVAPVGFIGWITPIGGILLMAGWIFIAIEYRGPHSPGQQAKNEL